MKNSAVEAMIHQQSMLEQIDQKMLARMDSRHRERLIRTLKASSSPNRPQVASWLARDPDEYVRRGLANALGNLGLPNAEQLAFVLLQDKPKVCHDLCSGVVGLLNEDFLVERLATDIDSGIRTEMASCLPASTQANKLIPRLLQDEVDSVRWGLAGNPNLHLFADGDAIAKQLSKDPNRDVREALARNSCFAKLPSASKIAIKLAKDDGSHNFYSHDPKDRIAVKLGLTYIVHLLPNATKIANILLPLAFEEDPFIVAECLGKIPPPKTRLSLSAWLYSHRTRKLAKKIAKSNDTHLRERLAQGIHNIPNASEVIEILVNDEDATVRERATLKNKMDNCKNPRLFIYDEECLDRLEINGGFGLEQLQACRSEQELCKLLIGTKHPEEVQFMCFARKMNLWYDHFLDAINNLRAYFIKPRTGKVQRQQLLDLLRVINATGMQHHISEAIASVTSEEFKQVKEFLGDWFLLVASSNDSGDTFRAIGGLLSDEQSAANLEQAWSEWIQSNDTFQAWHDHCTSEASKLTDQDTDTLSNLYPQAYRFPHQMNLDHLGYTLEVIQNRAHQQQVGTDFRHCVEHDHYCRLAERGELFLILKPNTSTIDSNPFYGASKANQKGLVLHCTEKSLSVLQARGFANRYPSVEEEDIIENALGYLRDNASTLLEQARLEKERHRPAGQEKAA